VRLSSVNLGLGPLLLDLDPRLSLSGSVDSQRRGQKESRLEETLRR
jgi:hypothetical protein